MVVWEHGTLVSFGSVHRGQLQHRQLQEHLPYNRKVIILTLGQRDAIGIHSFMETIYSIVYCIANTMEG